VPPPPGIDAAVILPRPADHEAGRRSLEDAMTELAATLPPPEAPPVVEVAPEARDEALRRYLRGREAALAGRHLEAVTSFKQARELDAGDRQIMRALVRSYLQYGVLNAAGEVCQTLLLHEPRDSEATLIAAMAAANRREFDAAAALLARAARDGMALDHDPAAPIIGAHVLAVCLRQLGNDRAFIEAVQPVLTLQEWSWPASAYQPRVESIARQRGDLWLDAGDAHARLGEPEASLAAYASGAALTQPDPATFLPRIVFASLRAGRPFRAQLELLGGLRSGGSETPDRLVPLCRYVREHTPEVALLAEAVIEEYRRSPESGGLARAAAALLPRGEAIALLTEFVRARPRDLAAVSHLLGWLAQQEASYAAEVAVGLVEAHPDLEAACSDRLVHAFARPGEAVRALRAGTSPAAHALLARVLLRLRGESEAWSAWASAHERWPGDRRLARLRLELAAALQEPVLLDEAVAVLPPATDASTLTLVARCRRLVGQLEQAIAAAQAAIDAAPETAAAHLELAQGRLVEAAVATDDEARRERVELVVSVATRALELEPASDDAFEVLFRVYGPGGASSDSARYRELAQRLLAASPDSALYARIAADELLAQRRFEQVLARILPRFEARPIEPGFLDLAIRAWAGLNRQSDAERWVRQQLDRRPGDPDLLEHWARLQTDSGRGDLVLEHLRNQLMAEPENPSAGRTMENVLRVMGRTDETLALTEARLLARPVAGRRELELAAALVAAGQIDRALPHLAWIEQHAATEPLGHLVHAVGLAARIDEFDPRRNPLLLALAEETVAHHPAAPLQVYGAGLLALAQTGRIGDAKFDALVQRAASASGGASDAGLRSAMTWRDLAQALTDAGYPEAAARALRARVRSGAGLSARAFEIVAMALLTAEAAAGEVAGTLELLQGWEAAGALDQLAPALDQSPPLALSTVLFEISQVHALIGHDAGADRLLTRVLELDPGHAMAMNNLGYMRLEAHAADEVTAALIERAAALEPDDPSILDTIGWLRYRQGRWFDEGEISGALTLIRRALEVDDSPSAEVLDHLGDTLWRSGDADGAIAAWQRAVAMLSDPAFEERMTRVYGFVQQERWKLIVAEPAAMYHRDFGLLLERAQRKIAAAREGGEPPVAPTFSELAAGGS
jgi:tetratricopeptide (TPR) repeat protein